MRRVSRPVLIALGAGLVVVVAVVVVLVATSGVSSPGSVTFRAGTTEVEADPTVYCDVGVTECENDPDAVAVAAVPPGTDVAVSVGDDVANTPWQLAFTFRDAAGAEQQGRSPVFPPGARRDFVLVLPDPAGRLETAEVQQYGAKLVETPEGVGFSTRSTWVLRAAP